MKRSAGEVERNVNAFDQIVYEDPRHIDDRRCSLHGELVNCTVADRFVQVTGSHSCSLRKGYQVSSELSGLSCRRIGAYTQDLDVDL